MEMAHEHPGGNHNAALQSHAHAHEPRTLPAVLTVPEAVGVYRMRALIAAVIFGLLSLIFLVPGIVMGREHLLRAYLMGYMTCFNLCGGAFALLMVQYVSGGKWGLVLRRPLEAMTRTFPFLVAGLLPILFCMKYLYQWAAFTTPAATLKAYHDGLVTNEQHLDIDAKHAMLSPVSVIVQAVIVFAFMGIVITLLNNWSMARDRDAAAGTVASFDKWRVRLENLSGPSILLYVILMTAFVIDFVKSLDVIWASSIYGLQFLVAQGYGVLALGILTLILLSRFEPMKTMFRATEQHDLGKLAFAFVMLNMYFTFAEFLIIWSGNIPDELDWYLHRIHGDWWYICSLDVICHFVIPFCLLLSRDIKRSKRLMIWIASFMIFARLIDMFWLIEPNFNDAAGNLHIVGNVSILAYVTVPLAMVSLWMVYYLTELGKRPLINVNDPHTEELLEPEHAH
jgi:hypothetical protein